MNEMFSTGDIPSTCRVNPRMSEKSTVISRCTESPRATSSMPPRPSAERNSAGTKRAFASVSEICRRSAHAR